MNNSNHFDLIERDHFVMVRYTNVVLWWRLSTTRFPVIILMIDIIYNIEGTYSNKTMYVDSTYIYMLNR